MIRGMSTIAAGALVAGLLPSSAGAFGSSATFKGMDVYRSESVTVERIAEKLSDQIEGYLFLRAEGRKSSLRRAEEIKRKIEAEVTAMGGLAFHRMHYAQYVTAAGRTSYITFEVVDGKDAKTRMPFRAAPTGTTADPEGLIAAWQQYDAAGKSYRLAGELAADRPTCAAFYCLWGSSKPELEAAERKFVQQSAPNRKQLLGVLAKEADPAKRVAAVYLLAYLPSGKDVVEIAIDSLADPDESVRGAGLQVLADMGVYHKEVYFDISRVIKALDFPTTGDRGKAMAVLIGVAEDPARKGSIIALGGDHLIRLLKLKQPINHDMAYTLLILLSKESHNRRDYKSWEAWLASQRSAPR